MTSMWDARIRAEAERQRALSQDPSTKVGAVVSLDGHIWGAGHNRLVRGSPPDFWSCRVLKYPHVVHAEVAAILDAAGLARDGKLTVTSHPCLDCARLAVAAGIACVECPPEPWRDDPEVRATCEGARAIFERAGVVVVPYG